MFDFFANTFGYVLNLLYNLLNNYGLAIILFTILIKIILLPISIKQQRTMKKSAKLQEQMKSIQFKYKNDPEKMNQEIMSLYKSENMSPMSGCLSSIIQLILLLSIFYLVKSPLTYMRKIPTEEFESVFEYDNCFHEQLVLMSGLPRLAKAWKELYYGNLLAGYELVNEKEKILAHQYDNHIAILKACKEGNPEKICDEVKKHYWKTIFCMMQEQKIKDPDLEQAWMMAI
jgi:YidC/Oxa1 family membrane protein insertase